MICNMCSSAVMGFDADPLSVVPLVPRLTENVPQLPGNSSSQLQTDPPHQKAIYNSGGVDSVGVLSQVDAVKLECSSSKFLS